MKKRQLLILSLCLTYVIGFMFIAACGVHNDTAFAIDKSPMNNYCGGVDDLDKNLYPVQTYASTDTNLNFPNQYYRNLTYHGLNMRGSCAYVAIGMFLSYYDTYWNDNVILERYDKTASISSTEYSGYNLSPGINDPLSSNSSVYSSDQNYKTYMYAQTNTNLHAYLLSLGDSMGYVGNGSSGSFGLTWPNTYNVLNKYLENYPAANSENFFYTYVDHSTDYETYTASMLQDIKTYVKLGQPVIVAIEGKVTGSLLSRVGHVIVAYDYDEDTDTLYGHYGWDSAYNHTKVLGEVNKYTFSYIQGYIVASPYESDHSHTNNYNLTSGQTVCACQLSSHEHMYHYEITNATEHRRYCYCGYSSYQIHRFSGTVGRYVVCEKCNYRKLNDGGIIEIPIESTTPEILEDMERIKDEIGKNQYLMSA